MSKLADHLRWRFDKTWSHPSWWNLSIVLPWVLGVGFALHEWATDRMIAQRQRTTDGTINKHEPANHDQYRYSFLVNGKSYNGWAIPRKQGFNVGQQVTVFYDPLDPTKNALSDFADLETESVGPIPLLLAGIGAVALFIRQRRRARSVQGNPAKANSS
jgi:hypothetical protein